MDDINIGEKILEYRKAKILLLETWQNWQM